MMSKSHVNRRNKRLISLFVVFRQVQNLRDELYQAKLRLEKETFSLKDTNKVTFLEQFSRWSKEPLNDIYFAALRSLIGQEKRTTLSLSTNQMQN